MNSEILKLMRLEFSWKLAGPILLGVARVNKPQLNHLYSFDMESMLLGR
jgi:hypothetical protein